MDSTRTRSEAAYDARDRMREKTKHAIRRAKAALLIDGWSVLDRHTDSGGEIFASKGGAPERAHLADPVWFARIRSRTADLFGGDTECSITHHLGKTQPEDAADEFIAIARRAKEAKRC